MGRLPRGKSRSGFSVFQFVQQIKPVAQIERLLWISAGCDRMGTCTVSDVADGLARREMAFDVPSR
jgi:hypothetical protein